MKSILICFMVLLWSTQCIAQEESANEEGNTSDIWLKQSTGKLFVGGYGEVHYNKPIKSGKINNAKVDMHRMVLLFGYNFTNKWSFITEIETEHVKEVFVEQAYIRYKHNNYFNFSSGLLLVPFGIINEYHEPTTFNGVERPFVDKYIIPTTWRTLGAGVSGNATDVSIKYQFFLMNGFSSYNGEASLSGANGLRKGRQKGSKANFTPNFSSRLTYYGIRGLKVGLSYFGGKTSTSLFNNVSIDNNEAILSADSTVVNIQMVGVDMKYAYKMLQTRAQFTLVRINNTLEYNQYANTDLGSKLFGAYIELGYNLLYQKRTNKQLILFTRLERYNTQASVENLTRNESYNRIAITTGLTYRISDAISLKTDYQFLTNASKDTWDGQLNIGFGVWFR